ncbi:MAG: sortase [Clostridiales bacterium]|nr:sortase [Clostridiales bacterium]
MRFLKRLRQRWNQFCHSGKPARRCGRAFVILGVCMLVAALGMEAHNAWEERQAGRETEQVYEELQTVIDILRMEETATPAEAEPDETGEETLDAEKYLGILRIPEFGLNLPVQWEWSYPALRQTPCRFTGSTREGDLVICAHNYATHFGKLRNLSYGATITLEEMDGTVRRYRVEEIEILGPGDIERLLSGNWPLTLFTCTYGGENRVVVRCGYDV